MSIDFPNSPTIGQTYTFGNKTWEWTGEAWTLLDTVTDASKFATTGSNTFNGNQVINGTLNVTGSGNMTVSASAGGGITLHSASPTWIKSTQLHVNNEVNTSWVLQVKPSLVSNPTASVADAGILQWVQSTSQWRAGRGDNVERILRQSDLDNAILGDLQYPLADGLEGQVIKTNGSATMSFGDVNTIYEDIYTGEAVTKGDPLYISGSEGAKPVVYLADAADATKMPVSFIAAETIGAANDSRGIVLGLIDGLDLTGLVAGDEVYVAEGGGWSTTKPSGSSSITQLLGVVTKGDVGGKGLVLNPGPATLPGLQDGYVWVGDNNNRATTVTTSSLSVASSVSASYAVTSSQADNVKVLTSASYAAITPVSGTIYIVTE